MKKEVNFSCVYCGDKKYNLIYPDVKGFKIVKCDKCQVVSTQPVPTEQELQKMYDDQILSVNGDETNMAENYLKDKSVVNKLGYGKRLVNIKKFAKGKKVLEIGCGAGLFLDYLRDQGFDVTGVEISPFGYKWAKNKLNLNVFDQDLLKLKFKENTFDAVMLYDVLEHIKDPKTYLEELNRILKKGGVLILNLPNFDSFMSKTRKADWVKLDPPQHLFHYTADRFQQILPKLNFKVLRMKTNTGANEELGEQLFLHSMGGETEDASLASFYRRYRKFLRPLKLGTFKFINLIFSIVGPVFNKVLVSLNKGEGLEIYAVKK